MVRAVGAVDRPGSALRIAIDAEPVGSDIGTAADYTALQVFGPTALPLFRDEAAPVVPNLTSAKQARVVPLGALGFEVADGGCAITVWLDDHIFSDGRRVSVTDYARGFARRLVDSTAPWRVFLRDLVGYEPGAGGNAKGLADVPGLVVHRDRLTFRLRRPNYRWPQVLCCPAFSPEHPSDLRRTAGAYHVANVSAAEVRLSANPDARAHLPDLTFLLIPDRYVGVNRYERGLLDVTCDTMFPYEWVDRYRGRDDFQTPPSAIAAVLRVHNFRHPLLADPDARRALAQAIDRSLLSSCLGGFARPLTSIAEAPLLGGQDRRLHQTSAFAACTVSTKPSDACQLPARAGPKCERPNLRLAYHDFYPNETIATALARQLALLVGKVELVREPYTSARSAADLRLELMYSPFLDPLSHLVTEAHCRSFIREREMWRAYIATVHAYQGEPDATKRAPLLERASRLLAQHAHVIALLRMPRFFLRRMLSRPDASTMAI